MTIFRRVLLSLGAALLLGAVFVNFAEFSVPQLKPRVTAALADLDPDLQVEAGDIYLSVQLFQGRIRTRMVDSQVRHPALGTRALSVDAVGVDLPLTSLIWRKPPSRVSVEGASLRLNMPDFVAEALPTPGAQETAADYWGFVFRGEFLADLAEVLPKTLPSVTALEDIELEVLDPQGQRSFFTVHIDSGQQRLTETGEGRVLPDVQVVGSLISQSGDKTPFEWNAQMESDGGARTNLRTGVLTPAKYYQFLRFAQLSTPERLTTPYRLIAQAHFLPGREGQTLSADIIEVQDDGQEHTFAVLNAKADPRTNEFTLHGEVSGVNTKRVAPWTPVPRFMADMNLAVTGSFDFTWNRLSNEWLGTFAVTQGNGTLAIPHIGLPSEPGGQVGVRDVVATGRFDRQGLILDQVRIATGSRTQVGPVLGAKISTLAGDMGPEIKVELTAHELRRGDLFYLWPTTVAAKTRVQVGEFVEAAAFKDLLFLGEYRLESSRTPGQQAKFILDRQEVHAEFDQAQVRITPDLPVFTHATGRLDLVNTALDIALEEADFGPAHMMGGTTNIDFSGPDWITIDIAGDLEGPLSPSLAVLADGNIGLTGLRALPLEAMSGQAEGRLGLTLAFNPKTIATQGISPDDIRIDTALAISDLRVTDYLLGDGLRSGSLDLRITDEGLTGQGLMDLDGVQGRVDVAQTFDEQATLRVSAQARVPASRVEDFVPGLEDFVSGTTQGKFEYVARAGQNSVLGIDLDLANVAVDFPALAYGKPVGSEGRLRLNLAMDAKGPVAAETIRLAAPGLSATGRLGLRGDSWTAISLNEVKVNASTLQDVTVRNLGDEFRVTIGGGDLDLEPLLDQFTNSRSAATAGPRSSEALGFALSKPVVIERARLRRLIADNDSMAFLSNVDMNLVVADDGVRGMTLKADVPPVARGGTGGQVNASMRGNRDMGFQLWLNSDNFGALLSALDMSPDVRGGDVVISGTSDYPLGGGPWALSGEAHDFSILDTPGLVKIASAISLTGILEQMAGTGLLVSDLEFQGTLAAPVLHVQRAKLDGPSLGISLAGALNWKQGVMNFRGALSLLNIVSMAVSDIPLLGTLLTGANGQGLFASQFQISGRFEDPKVAVDPLSIIQPGILRSIIDEIEGQEY